MNTIIVSNIGNFIVLDGSKNTSWRDDVMVT